MEVLEMVIGWILFLPLEAYLLECTDGTFVGTPQTLGDEWRLWFVAVSKIFRSTEHIEHSL